LVGCFCSVLHHGESHHLPRLSQMEGEPKGDAML